MNDSIARRTGAGLEVRLGHLEPAAEDALFDLFAEVVATGEGFPHAAPLSRGAFVATWLAAGVTVIGAQVDGSLAGAYYLRANFPGRAAHIANAGYVVGRRWRRQGIGRLLIEDSITRAPSLGFDAVQFNLVFASNPARALYEALGWQLIGRVPDAVGGEEGIIYWRRV